MQVDEHAAGGAAVQQRAVVDGVVLHPALQQRVQVDDVLAEQGADEVEAVRREVDGRAAARDGRVGAPVVVRRAVGADQSGGSQQQ